jgi:hypothetical protein
MVLIKCKDCGRDVSTSAAACPGCGAPIANAPIEKKTGSGAGVGCLVIGIVAVGLMIVVGQMDAPSPTSSPRSSTTSASSRHPFEPASQDGLALRLQARRLINSAGERCDAVANTRAGGRVDNGDFFLLADCSGGNTHALLVTPADQIRYYMSCESAFNPVC